MQIVSLEKSQPRTLCASLQHVDSSGDRSSIFPQAEGLVRHHHAHLLHEWREKYEISPKCVLRSYRRASCFSPLLTSEKWTPPSDKSRLLCPSNGEQNGQQVARNDISPSFGRDVLADMSSCYKRFKFRNGLCLVREYSKTHICPTFVRNYIFLFNFFLF